MVGSGMDHLNSISCTDVETASVVLEFLAADRRCIVYPVRYELNLYMLCRRK
jgi:hypothetical protein